MLFDGYSKLEGSRLEQFKRFSTQQSQVNARLKEIAQDMNGMPKMPHSIDQWIESFGGLTKKSFGIDTFVKQSKMSKEYHDLIDKSEANFREMKIIFIEDLIDKINHMLDPNDQDITTQQ